MKKKFLVIMLAMGMSLSLAACGSSAGSEDQGQVYIKIPPLMNFYPDREKYEGVTYYDDYFNSGYLVTIIESDDASATVSYEMDEGDHYFINWCKEFVDQSWSYEISEPETWDNGIVAYEVTSIYDDQGSNTVQYVLYYPLEDGSEIMVCTSGFLGSPHLAPQGFQESHDTIMEFYRTAEDLFVVVDPETMEVVVK